MAKKKNILTENVEELHRKLALSNFAAFTAEGAAKRDKKQAEKIVKNGGINSLITMAALVGTDTHEPNPAKVFAVTYGAGMVRKKDAIRAVEEANGNAQADAIANGFEAVERFVVDVTSKFLYGKRGQVPIKNKTRQRARKRFGKKAGKENTPTEFRQIVAELASRNCDELFKILFKHVDGLDERVANYHFGDLRDIHLAVEQIRHCKTHANGRYVDSNYENLPKKTREIIKSLVQESVIHGDERILPSYKHASDLLAREAEYGQILYEQVGDALGMKRDYCPS